MDQRDRFAAVARFVNLIDDRQLRQQRVHTGSDQDVIVGNQYSHHQQHQG